MKASIFLDAQKAFIFKLGDDGVKVSEICCKARISSAPYFKLKKKYAGLLTEAMLLLKVLEDKGSDREHLRRVC